MPVQTRGKSAKAGATNAKAAGTSPAASVVRPLQGGNSAGAGNIEPALELRALIGVVAFIGLAEMTAMLPAVSAALRLRRLGPHPVASPAP